MNFIVRYPDLLQKVINTTYAMLCGQVDQIVNNPCNKHTLHALQAVERERSRADQERARADREEDKRKSLEREVEFYKAALRLAQGATVEEPSTQ